MMGRLRLFGKLALLAFMAFYIAYGTWSICVVRRWQANTHRYYVWSDEFAASGAEECQVAVTISPRPAMADGQVRVYGYIDSREVGHARMAHGEYTTRYLAEAYVGRHWPQFDKPEFERVDEVSGITVFRLRGSEL